MLALLRIQRLYRRWRSSKQLARKGSKRLRIKKKSKKLILLHLMLSKEGERGKHLQSWSWRNLNLLRDKNLKI
jgi:hypothetical protein